MEIERPKLVEISILGSEQWRSPGKHDYIYGKKAARKSIAVRFLTQRVENAGKLWTRQHASRPSRFFWRDSYCGRSVGRSHLCHRRHRRRRGARLSLRGLRPWRRRCSARVGDKLVTVNAAVAAKWTLSTCVIGENAFIADSVIHHRYAGLLSCRAEKRSAFRRMSVPHSADNGACGLIRPTPMRGGALCKFNRRPCRIRFNTRLNQTPVWGRISTLTWLGRHKAVSPAHSASLVSRIAAAATGRVQCAHDRVEFSISVTPRGQNSQGMRAS